MGATVSPTARRLASVLAAEGITAERVARLTDYELQQFGRKAHAGHVSGLLRVSVIQALRDRAAMKLPEIGTRVKLPQPVAGVIETAEPIGGRE